MRDRRRLVLAVLGLVALSGAAGGLAGCSGASSSGSESSAAAHSALRQGVSGGVVQGSAASKNVLGPPSDRGSGREALVASIQPARLPSAVIRTARVQLRVGHNGLQDGLDRVQALLPAEGYVATSSLSRAGQRSATIVVRVPERRFGAVLRAIEHIGAVQSESQTGVDVTREFIDLGARLENLRAQERFLRGLMAQAQTVAASITIENHLTQVELGIEQITGQLRYLQNRTSFSTISVELTEAGAKPPVHHHASTLWKAGGRSLGGALQIVVAVIVGAGYVIPLALLALLGLAAARLLRPRLPRPAAPGGDSSGGG